MRSVNQNHHLYVITANGTIAAVTDNSAKGSIYPYVSGDTQNQAEKDLYFLYKGRDCITRSDLIPINQISYIKYVSATDQRTPLKTVTVTLDSNLLDDDGNAIVGQDYVLNIAFQQFYGLSPEDTYVKTVALHVTNATKTPVKFFEALKKELNAAFAREIGATATENPYLSFENTTTTDDDNNTVNCLVITEKNQEQFWSLGKWESESLMFEVFPSTIVVGGYETEWGTTKNGVSNTTVPNSKKMADLEWFTFAERGDFYRGMGYPNNFDFIPLVDPDNADGYSALEIHFAYQGTCEDIQKSEKDITIIGSDAKINSLISVLEGQKYLNRTIKPAQNVGG